MRSPLSTLNSVLRKRTMCVCVSQGSKARPKQPPSRQKSTCHAQALGINMRRKPRCARGLPSSITRDFDVAFLIILQHSSSSTLNVEDDEKRLSYAPMRVKIDSRGVNLCIVVIWKGVEPEMRHTEHQQPVRTFLINLIKNIAFQSTNKIPSCAMIFRENQPCSTGADSGLTIPMAVILIIVDFPLTSGDFRKFRSHTIILTPCWALYDFSLNKLQRSNS